GMTWLGGSSNLGVVFSFDRTTNTYINVHNFVLATGYQSRQSKLILDANGMLYGMTLNGGGPPSGVGVIFMFDPNSNMYFDDFHCVQSIGMHPQGSLVLASDNLYYGLMNNGGLYGSGVIFSFDGAANYSDLYNFPSTSGFPTAGLMQGSNGLLYGIAGGQIFSYDISTAAFQICST